MILKLKLDILTKTKYIAKGIHCGLYSFQIFISRERKNEIGNGKYRKLNFLIYKYTISHLNTPLSCMVPALSNW